MTTPDNAIYYQLAYSVAAIIYVGYAVSIVIRTRRLMARAREMHSGLHES